MKVGTKQLETHEVGASSVTRVGKFLRKTKLDELPQLINILKGELSFVEPRRCLPNQTELIDERASWGFRDLAGYYGIGAGSRNRHVGAIKACEVRRGIC